MYPEARMLTLREAISVTFSVALQVWRRVRSQPVRTTEVMYVQVTFNHD